MFDLRFPVGATARRRATAMLFSAASSNLAFAAVPAQSCYHPPSPDDGSGSGDVTDSGTGATNGQNGGGGGGNQRSDAGSGHGSQGGPSDGGSGSAGPGAGGALNTSKMGVGAWAQESSLQDLHTGWYYSWSPTPIVGGGSSTFVPMIWGSKHMGNISSAQGPVMLGFNEPDHGDQANMHVGEAVSDWSSLTATGKKLGSPATAEDPSKGYWLRQFLDQVGPGKVDFLCLHWYGGDANDPTGSVTKLKDFLTRNWQTFGAGTPYNLKEIWLTEYALSLNAASEDNQAAFASQSAQMMNSLPFVTHYAWFALSSYNGMTSQLYDNGGSITPVGKAYKAANGLQGTGQ